MKSSKEAKRTAKKLFAASLVDDVLDLPTVQKVVRRISESKPRGYLRLLDAYWLLVRLEVARNRAVVESASVLDPATAASVAADLKKKYGQHIEPEFSINPELLGGLRIRVGSDVWDGSVQNRLERLAEKFQ
jgi:F-type H+-transporting ATPase subunit delta